MSLTALLVFAATEFLLSLTPGPAVLTVISQGIRHGTKLSLRGAAGILTGNAIYFAISAVGLGAVFAASEVLFNLIKYLGAGYLIYLGGSMVLAKDASRSDAEGDTSGKQLYVQGLTTQLANPKAIIFFTALLPQFIDAHSNVGLQCLVLGIISIGVEFPVLLLYGFMAERGRDFMKNSLYARRLDRIAGTFLIGAGMKLAFTNR